MVMNEKNSSFVESLARIQDNEERLSFLEDEWRHRKNKVSSQDLLYLLVEEYYRQPYKSKQKVITLMLRLSDGYAVSFLTWIKDNPQKPPDKKYCSEVFGRGRDMYLNDPVGNEVHGLFLYEFCFVRPEIFIQSPTSSDLIDILKPRIKMLTKKDHLIYNKMDETKRDSLIQRAKQALERDQALESDETSYDNFTIMTFQDNSFKSFTNPNTKEYLPVLFDILKNEYNSIVDWDVFKKMWKIIEEEKLDPYDYLEEFIDKLDTIEDIDNLFYWLKEKNIFEEKDKIVRFLEKKTNWTLTAAIDVLERFRLWFNEVC